MYRQYPQTGCGALAASIGLTPNRIVLIIALILVAYFGVIGVSNATHNASLAREQRVLERETTGLAAELARLRAVKSYVKSDEFVEGTARNQLGLVRPGETLVRIIPEVKDGAAPPDGPPGPWWERLFGR